jgi:DNA-directed RNA polymerase subunit K/omega
MSINNINDSAGSMITDPAKRITSNILSKYEVSAILAKRARDLETGSKYDPRVLQFIPAENISNITIAETELKYGLIPYYIYREVGDNIYERWSVSEMYYRAD